MSTERPDNDATDPAAGHARGPADGTAEDAVTGSPGETTAGNAVTAAPGEDSGKDRDERPAGKAVTGSPEEAVTDSAGQPVTPDAEDGAPAGAAEDSPASAAQADPANAAAGGPTSPAADTEKGGPEGTDENTAEDSPASPAENTAQDTAGEDPGKDTVAAGSSAPSGQDRGEDTPGVVPPGPDEGSRDEEPDRSSPAGSVADEVVVPVEGAGAHEGRRRRTPAAVASVVAAVLLVGGGGAYLTATASGGGRSGTAGSDATPPPLALDGYTTATGATGGNAGIAPGEPDPYGSTYRASGTLPAGPGSAHVRWAEGKVTRAEVARLAKALGLAGTPRLTGDAWTVGAVKDGNEPNLRVTADAPGTWTFASALPGGDNCVKVTTCSPGDPGSAAGSASDPVSEATARKAAAPVLKALGQDGAKLDTGQLMGQVRVVNADPVLGGLPTYGWTTGLRIGSSGHVVGGSGQLKTPVEGDAYPVVSARKTLDLMNGSAPATDGRRMGIGGCASPVPLKDRDEMPCEHPSPAKPQATTVEKATFGLAEQRANGRQALVPSWLFEVRSPGAQDTYTVTHTAVDPAFLASPQSPAPPSAEPTLPTLPVPSGQPSSPAARHDVAVQGYTADGRELKVDFTGGVCADYTVSAHETSDKVTVTVTEKPWKNKVCIMIAKIYERTVRLDAPLDGREVVGSDGKAIHHGRFGIPETSAATPAEPR
ncbi:hypothetical protein [Streptomyces aureus]